MTNLVERPAIIGLAGRMKSGKNKSAELILEEYADTISFKLMAFGAFVKGEVYANTVAGLPIPSFFPQDVRQILGKWRKLTAEQVLEAVSAKPTSDDARRVLQYWGTEYRRKQDPAYWVKTIASQIRPGQSYIFTDVRFHNEFQFLRSLNGAVYYIDRPGLPEASAHSSEAYDWIDLPKWRSTNGGRYVIDNDGSIDDLRQRVLDQTEAVIWKTRGRG